jgi:hypothetical protein
MAAPRIRRDRSRVRLSIVIVHDSLKYFGKDSAKQRQYKKTLYFFVAEQRLELHKK